MPTRRLSLLPLSIAMALAALPACAGGSALSAKSPSGYTDTGTRVSTSSGGLGRVEEASAERYDGALAQSGSPSPAPPMQSPAPSPTEASPSAERPAERGSVLIYTAELTMAVFEVEPGLGKVEELGRELGGFLARRDNAAITIRVPADRFNEAIRRIAALGDVLHRSISAEDVTDEYRDVEVRLKNARAMRARLEQLLVKADKIDDSIAIERELGRVTGEIERMEGRLKLLRDRAALSTITVAFRPRTQPSNNPAHFQLPVPWLRELGLVRLLDL